MPRRRGRYLRTSRGIGQPAKLKTEPASHWPVLRSTFLHLPGIDPALEVSLWSRGIRDWSDLRNLEQAPEAGRYHAAILDGLSASEEAMRNHDAAYFARRLPTQEHWRMYPALRDRLAFLDIETTGLSPYEGSVTVASVHSEDGTRTFIADEDLEELPAYLRRFDILSTFNGLLFDVPFLQVRFPQFVPPPGHIDLRFVLRRIGQVGGLKAIERRLGVGDRTGVEGIFGPEAVRLWEQHRRGNPDALRRLVEYNRADTVNLRPLLDFAVTQLLQRLVARGAVRPGPEIRSPSER